MVSIHAVAFHDHQHAVAGARRCPVVQRVRYGPGAAARALATAPKKESPDDDLFFAGAQAAPARNPFSVHGAPENGEDAEGATRQIGGRSYPPGTGRLTPVAAARHHRAARQVGRADRDQGVTSATAHPNGVGALVFCAVQHQELPEGPAPQIRGRATPGTARKGYALPHRGDTVVIGHWSSLHRSRMVVRAGGRLLTLSSARLPNIRCVVKPRLRPLPGGWRGGGSG